MPLMVLGLVVAGSLLILAVLATQRRERRRLGRDEGCAYAGDASWSPALFSDGGASDCGAADAGGGCDGGGGGGD